MKSFKYLMFSGLAVLCIQAMAQSSSAYFNGPFGYYKDALLFSQTSNNYGSTARMQGIGGTQISLGADISSAASNPAGLGFFNRSVVSFTPSMNFQSTNSTYLGAQYGSFRNNFNIGNVGVVLNSNKGDYTDEKFKGGSFAISFSRSNNFNNDFFYQGRNGVSVIDQVLVDAGTDEPALLSKMPYSAYKNFLIDPVYDQNTDELLGYDSFVLGSPLQSEDVRTNGSQGQLNFAWGGNYNDRIYFGGGIGLTSVNYQIIRTYREQLFLYQDDQGNDQIDDWIDYTQFRDELSVTGSGINANVGIIVRPVDFITIGASYISPTYYSLEDESGFVQSTRWNNVELDNGDILNNESYSSDIVINQYNLKTPPKFNLGATVFLGKNGFISGDVEFVDFTNSQLRSSDFIEAEDNKSINDLYRNVVNYKVGSEFRVDNFRIRGGYAFFGDPYDDGDLFDESRRNISFGVGYRSRDYFVDLAFVNSKTNELYGSYLPLDGAQNSADIELMTNTVSATVGFNF